MPQPRKAKASLPRRIWKAWWVWTFMSLGAVLLAATTGSGVVLGVGVLLAFVIGLAELL